MDKHKKLGRLVVQHRKAALRRNAVPDAGPDKAGSPVLTRRAKLSAGISTTIILISLAIGVGMLYASGWLPAQFRPRKLIVRGCVISQPADVLARLECTSQSSYMELMRQANAGTADDERWFRGAKVSPLLSRAALITVSERQPVLRVVIGSAKYWLCSDGTLAPMDAIADHGGAYDRIRRLPSIEMAANLDGSLPSADALLTAAACCEELMPGLIDRICLNDAGMLDLYDRKGFRVHLGDASGIEAKIAALPQALRLCAADRDRLKYLDASNPFLFYQVWKEPQTPALTGKG